MAYFSPGMYDTNANNDDYDDDEDGEDGGDLSGKYKNTILKEFY